MIGGKMVLVGRGKRGFSLGNALEFDAVNDSVTFGDFTPLNGASKATLAVRLKQENLNAGFLIGCVNDLGSNGFYLINIGGVLYTQSRQNNTLSNVTNYTFTDNDWHHLAMVYDGALDAADRLKTYVDGINVKYSTYNAPPTSLNASTGEDFRINGKFSQNAPIWTDELIFAAGVAATQEQITELASGIKSAKDIIPSAQSYYDFNEINGTTLPNKGTSAPSFNGTLNNFDVSECPYDGVGNTCPWKPFNS